MDKQLKKKLKSIFDAASGILLVGMLGGLGTIGVMTVNGHTNSAATITAAKEMGFSHIDITGKGSYHSCDNKHENGDWYRTKFSAVSKSGLPVTGVVCETPGLLGNGLYVHISSVSGIQSTYVNTQGKPFPPNLDGCETIRLTSGITDGEKVYREVAR